MREVMQGANVARTRAKSRNHPKYTRAVDRYTDDRETDPGLWLTLNSRFNFTVDAAATEFNAKLARFWTLADDGLKQSWGHDRVWCNPPFSDLAPWIAKAWTATRVEGCPLAVILLPADRCDQPFWQQLVEPFRDRPGSGLRTHFQPGRPRFGRPDGNWKGRPPFGLVILIFEPGTR